MSGECTSVGERGTRRSTEGLFVGVAGMAPGTMRVVEVDDLRILVCHAEGAFYAIENRCPHAGVPLEAGRLSGCVLECPLHGGRLDVRDGGAVDLPIRRPARTYRVAVVEGGIEVDLSREGSGAPCTT